ncbi:PP2C family protein-serine/threonine phosphatase [Agaribacterium haliotis]|uniref:PP2C family protein-serine/threonine phosphatase n=1 Tax=Agaribacterium haliotis TaxID=2013869 RepID=UPI000BB555C4|nr:protein phosphatase 2C domain-containing protein [Agaribacterium haliotis]
MFGTTHAAATDLGLLRDNNEDAIFASAELGLWIVADGMGGHAAGEVASALAIDCIKAQINLGRPLAEAIQLAHRAIVDAANNGVGGHGMGSTVVALSNRGDDYEICWVGDSRAYLYQKASANGDEDFRQLSTDHSYVQMLYQNGAISEDELATHPERNIITQCLGSVDLQHLKVDQVVGSWHKDMRILLCSDGLSDVVDAHKIKHVLASARSPDAACRQLISAALDSGGKDNVSVAVIETPSLMQKLVSRCRNALQR